MLSIGKLGSGSEDYYLSAVAAGREDYYLRADEAPGRWLADGGLDLSGEVGAPELRALLAGRDPRHDSQLVRGPAGRARTPGFDLTFSAPKSVSLLFALGDPDQRAAAIGAHERAVEAAIGYLQDHAAFLRRGHNGAERVPALGLFAAGFRHRASRAGDPALHTHVLVANIAQDHEGRFGALDSRAIYRNAKSAGYLYQAELRHRLTTDLGVAWGPVLKGAADIAGFPPEVLAAFSRRRAEIEERLVERGESGRRAAEVAALDTRAAKDYSVRGEDLVADWRARAIELGFGPRVLETTLWRAQVREPDPGELAPLFDALGSPEGLTAHQPTFTRQDALRELCARAGPMWGAGALGEAADLFLASEHAVLLAPDEAHAPARYSTPELLATERELLQGAIERQREGAGLVEERTIRAVLAGRHELSHEQAAMVRGLAGSGDGVQVVLGRAGSGKTHALEPAREAWERGGYEVIGAALAARAATELQAGSGIPSRTLARLLIDAADLERSPLHAMSVVVLDEAGMVGTRDLAELARHAHEAGAKLVLVGDDAQLSEIAAGGSFRALAQSLGAIELTDNRRQGRGWEHQALAAIREGRAREAIDAYLAHGRIHVAPGAEAARRELVAGWFAAHRQGHEALMIAPRLTDAAELSRAARGLLVAAGEVGGPERQLACGPVAAGDRVMARRNDPGLGVQNGMRATVLGTGRQGCLRIVSDAGALLELPSDYLADGHLAYGYAITAHKAQGMSVDHAFVLGSAGLDREWGYTALSRARAGSHLYLSADGPSAAARATSSAAATSTRPRMHCAGSSATWRETDVRRPRRVGSSGSNRSTSAVSGGSADLSPS